MKYSLITVLSLLICALLASSINAQEQSNSDTIKIKLFSGSGAHWIAFNIEDGGVDMTTAVQMKDSAEGASWTSMKFVDGWAHWILESATEFVFPVSVRLTSETEQEIVLDNIIASLDVEAVDTGVQYSEPRMEVRGKGNSNGRNKSKRPTKAPTTQAPSTDAPATSASTTKAATTKATTTARPTTSGSTKATTTKPPTVVTTPKASTGSSGKMGLMVPLYMYPGSAWNTVAASGSKVPTVAIINPNSGPGNGPDSTFKTYMATLQNAKVEQIGYVHTSYGARSITEVKAEIAKYASEFPQVTGIFLDEAAADASKVSYYTQVYNYVMSMPGYKYCVLNPGAVPTQAYYAISTQIVSFETTVSKFASSANPSYASAAVKDHFSVISYGASKDQMKTAIQTAKSKGYYGWVYFTDNSSAATYNTLPSYYAEMATEVAAQN